MRVGSQSALPIVAQTPLAVLEREVLDAAERD
jgi:hypothetical protein